MVMCCIIVRGIPMLRVQKYYKVETCVMIDGQQVLQVVVVFGEDGCGLLMSKLSVNDC